MCGRFEIHAKPEVVQEHYHLTETPSQMPISYNLAPGQKAGVITRNSPNKLEVMQWGLIPSWAKDPRIGFKMINARSEGLMDRPAYRLPFTRQRCLVPITGFYEWQKTEEGKVPYYFHFPDTDVVSLAGLYDTWRDIEGRETTSFTIITTTANKLVADYHDRMPVVLTPEEEGIWLDKQTSPQTLTALLDPFPENRMAVYRVSNRVNQAANNDISLITREY